MKKKSQNNQDGLVKLKDDLKNQAFSSMYLLYGEESYLREHYVKELRDQVLPPGSEAFNLHEFSGNEWDFADLEEAIDSFPMMSPRSLVMVTDWDFMKLGEAQGKAFLALIQDLPEHCTLVFHFDLLEYRPDKRKKITQTVDKIACVVELAMQDETVLVPWIQNQRIPALGKVISSETAREFVFYCGNSMTNLITEMEKISAYAQEEEITMTDVREVALPHINAIVFQICDAMGEKDFDLAIKVLGDLFQIQEKSGSKKREKELGILGALSRHFRLLYMAKLSVEEGKTEASVAGILGVQSFVARKIISSSRRFSLSWCRNAVVLCGETDKLMKSGGGEGEALLTMLLLKLALE